MLLATLRSRHQIVSQVRRTIRGRTGKKETTASQAAANPGRPGGNEMTVKDRPTRVGDVDQAPPQRAGRGVSPAEVDHRSRRFCSMLQHGGEWVRNVTVGDQVKIDHGVCFPSKAHWHRVRGRLARDTHSLASRIRHGRCRRALTLMARRRRKRSYS